MAMIRMAAMKTSMNFCLTSLLAIDVSVRLAVSVIPENSRSCVLRQKEHRLGIGVILSDKIYSR